MPKRTNDQTPQQGAAGELLKRRGIRNGLSEWARYRGFDPAPHHQLFIREIEAFLESNDEVLLLFAPPGSAKSTYVSILLPSWYLATIPPTAFSLPPTMWSSPSDGADGFVTTLPWTARCLAFRSRKTAKRLPGGL